MKSFKKMMIYSTIGMAVLFLVSGCGSSSSSNVLPVVSSPNSTYLVEYVAGSAAATEGKTAFQIKVKNRTDGSAAAGLALKLTATMHMSTKDHGTPVDVVTESPAGTYNCTVYYLMGDHMMATLMGYWELQVGIGAETASFYPTVGSQMASADTWKASMKSASDTAGGKAYYLFSDGMVSASSPTFRLYISRAEDNPPTIFSAISAVSSPSGTVNSVIVTASTTTDFASPVTASDSGNGHFSMPMSALSTTGTYTVYVKLSVNAEDKTSDGLATNASGTNLYQTFKVTSH